MAKANLTKGTWLVVYYASAQCAKLLSVGQWVFIAYRRRRRLKRECDWRDAVRTMSSSGLLKAKSAIYWRSQGALLLSPNKRAVAPSQCKQCSTFTPSFSASEKHSAPLQWRSSSFWLWRQLAVSIFPLVLNLNQRVCMFCESLY